MILQKARSKDGRTRFPPSIFIIFLLVLLLMSGIHTGLIVLMNALELNDIVQSVIPILYWSVVAVLLTLFTRYKIKKTYDTPMKNLAEASGRVARGDFSVYIPPLHTGDKTDYLDIMIGDFNKMVEELGSIETLKTDFFSNVSHEFKTPLSVIQNCSELLLKKNITDNQRLEYAETISQASHRLSGLITNMLKLNKLEKQAIAPAPEIYDVCGQLCECVFRLEDMWEKKNINFTVDIEDRAFIVGDEGLFESVWNNLLLNAFKFTQNGGMVSLKQISKGEEIWVTVSDNGCGMDENTVKHIFDKFYQGDISHSAEGNGLGLALVQRILQLSSSEITVKSALGKGSEFTVKIPACVK